MTEFEIEFLQFLEKLPPREVSGLTAKADEMNIRPRIVKLANPNMSFSQSCMLLKNINEIFKNTSANSKGMIRPQIYRQAVYFVIYRELLRRYVNGQQKKNIEKEVIDKAGLLETMYRKWRIAPAYDFEMDFYNPALWNKNDFFFWGIDASNYHYKYYGGVELNVERAGKKRKQLIYMINCLILQTHPRCVVDMFGGTGTVTTSMPAIKKQYLNEYDKVVYNFIEMVKFHSSVVLKYAKEINEEIRSIEKWDKRFSIGEEFFAREKEGFFYKAESLKNLRDFICKLLGFWTDLKDKFNSGYFDKKLSSDISKEEKCKIAAYWYFVNHKEFKTMQAVTDTSQSGIEFVPYQKYLCSLGYKYLENIRVVSEDKDTNIRFLKKLNRQDFKKNKILDNDILPLLKYAKRLDNVELLSEDFRDVFRLFRNTPDAVLYVDPPYFLTTQYSCVFPVSFHVDLLDKLKQYRGKWVFSCKMEVTNKTANEQSRRGNGGSIIAGGLKDYFKGFLYDFTEEYGVYSLNMSSKIRKESEFYVLLSGENNAYSEIIITNFDFNPPKEPMDYETVMSERNTFKSSGVVSKKIGFGRFLESIERGDSYKQLWDSVP